MLLHHSEEVAKKNILPHTAVVEMLSVQQHTILTASLFWETVFEHLIMKSLFDRYVLRKLAGHPIHKQSHQVSSSLTPQGPNLFGSFSF